MSVVAPPEPPRPDELEAQIREARARQRRRWLIGAVVVAAATGLALAIAAVLAGGSSRHAVTGGHSASPAKTSSPCSVRVVGTRILRGQRIVYREPVPRTFGHQVACSGPAIWVVFFNGVASSQEGYFGVRSGNAGRTWRAVFTERYFGMKAAHQLDDYLGPWTVTPHGAFFIGLCPACDPQPTVSLWATKDGGRTFKRVDVAALDGYGPTAISVSGDRVTITAGHGDRRRSSTVRVS
jgi:hypothetical protein